MSTLVLGDILYADNAFIIIAAIGATFVILSGGIDFSIGSMIRFVGVVMANLDAAGWHPLASALVMLAFCAAFGALQGFILLLRYPAVHNHARWLVLLRGAFHGQSALVRCCHLFVSAFAGANIPLPGEGFLASSAPGDAVGWSMASSSLRIGRSSARPSTRLVGIRNSAALMGVPMRRTLMTIYGLGGLYRRSAASSTRSTHRPAGNPLAGTGSVAQCVFGGGGVGDTLLTGGVGFVAGALFGGMILA